MHTQHLVRILRTSTVTIWYDERGPRSRGRGVGIYLDGVSNPLYYEEEGMILERIISAWTLWFIGLREMRSWQ